MTRFDKLDLRMMASLQQDGRLSNAKLAAALAISETPCWRRLKRLEEEGVIEGYQALLNRRKLELGVLAFVHLSFTQHGEEVTAQIERSILASENVLTCHNVSGDADFMLTVVAKDLDDYSRFVETTLRKLPGVSAIRSTFSLREIKASNRLPVAHLGA
jgi:DNA-binding Lrp family transcriptional regulator